jgi:hypothetical protein
MVGFWETPLQASGVSACPVLHCAGATRSHSAARATLVEAT